MEKPDAAVVTPDHDVEMGSVAPHPAPPAPHPPPTYRYIPLDMLQRDPAIHDWMVLKGQPNYVRSPDYIRKFNACKRSLAAFRAPPSGIQLADEKLLSAVRRVQAINDAQRKAIKANREITASVAEAFSWKNSLHRFDYDPAIDEPLTGADDVAWFLAGLIGFIIACVAFGLFFVWANATPFWNAACPVSPISGLVCNGGTCTLSGHCICPSAIFSGTACDESACPGYDSQTNTVCSANGICSPFMTPLDVPFPCRWSTPSVANNFKPDNMGWYAPGCVAYLKAKRDQRDALALTRTSPLTTSQLFDLDLFGVPNCLCLGSVGGDACNTEACPHNSENQVCSGNGNSSVQLFNNATTVGNGCQCDQVLSFVDSQIAAVLPDYAISLIRTNFLTQFNSLFCGQLVTATRCDLSVPPICSAVVYLDQGINLKYVSTAVKCYCDDEHYGQGCEFGTCPLCLDDQHQPCCGRGHPSYGIGFLFNTSKATNRNAPCAPICSGTSKLCGVGNVCEPDGFNLFSSSQLCGVLQSAPTFSKYRCGDSTLQPANLLNPPSGVSNCDFGYEYGYLDPSWFSDARTAGTCDLTSNVSLALCFDPASSNIQVLPSGHLASSNVSVVQSTLVHVPVTTLAWFHFVVEPLGLSTTAQINISYANLVFSFTAPPNTKTPLAGVLNISESLYNLNLFVNASSDTSGGLPNFLGSLVLVQNPGSATSSSPYSLLGVPLLDTIPTTWSDFRLVLSNSTSPTPPTLATYVRVFSSTLSPLTSNISSSNRNYTGYALLVSVPSSPDNNNNGAVVATDGTFVGWTTCLSQPSLCAWLLLGNLTAVSPLTQSTACWDGFEWNVVSTPSTCTAVLPPSGFLVSLTMALGIRNRVPFPLAARLNVTGAWTVQLPLVPAGSPPLFNFTLVTSTPLIVTQAEIVSHALLQTPCACPPQFLGIRLVNRTLQDTIWGNSVDGQRLSFAAGTEAVGAFQAWGLPIWRRGTVAGGDELLTQISIKGWGTADLITSQTRGISSSQFRSGLDDAPLPVYSSRCPTGYLSTTALQITNLTESCSCSLVPPPLLPPSSSPTLATFQNSASATCTCNPSVSCSCVLPSVSSGIRPTCDCDTSDAGFSDRLALDLSGLLASCSCFAVPPPDRGIGSPDGSHLSTVLPTGTALVVSAPNATLLSITADSCFAVNNVTGFDSRFSSNVSLDVTVLCSNLSSLEIVVATGTEGFSSFLVNAGDVPSTTTLVAHWSPGGIAVRDIDEISPSYTASSTASGTNPGNAIQFEGNWWSSDPAVQLAGAPVYLAVGFETPTPLTRIVVSVRSAAQLLGPSLHIFAASLVLEARQANAPPVLDFYGNHEPAWTFLATLVSNATGLPGNDLQRFEFAFPQPSNFTVLWTAVRIRSPFSTVALQIRELVPFIDQLCTCGFAVPLADDNPTIYVQPSPPSVDTQTLWDVVNRWTFVQSPAEQATNGATCFCRDSCLIQTSEAGLVDVSNDGICQDAGPGGVDPTIGCAAGNDCTDCGFSTRLNTTGTSVSALGLPCSLDAPQLLVLGDIQNGTAASEWRSITNFPTVFIRDLLVPRTAITFGLQDNCAGAICPPFTFRCPDASCQSDPSCPASRFTCPGNGCLPASVNTRQYSCACAETVTGERCDVDATIPPDPYRLANGGTGGSNPYAWNTWAGPAPLCEQPPFEPLVPILNVDNAEILRLNRLWQPRTNQPGDVMNLRIKPHYGYGKATLRTTTLQGTDGHGDVIDTLCDYGHFSPLGRPVYLDDDVQTRSSVFPFVITQYTCYATADGSPCVTYPWNTEVDYDEIPFPAANGACVEGPAAAALAVARNPNCNNLGTPIPWGMCRCNPGWTTFFVTSKFTQSTKPFAVDPISGLAVPGTWNLPISFNWRDFSLGMCLARDCNVVDCSPPLGCFPGTPSKGFKDKLVQCPNPVDEAVGQTPVVGANRQGRCAVTLADCNGGLTFPRGVCSFNGLPRIRDYRLPEEHYCECGDPISMSAVDYSQGIRDTTQLVKNGWGGPRCDVYFCDDTSGLLQFSTRDPITGLAYTDLGQPIPGVWVGYCGAPIGPDPADASIWRGCCAETRLARCTSIPCTLGGVNQCLSQTQCLVRGGKPLVYPCNNHGSARKDGTCACTVDEDAGTGFTSDPLVFDTQNCYGTVTCPISPACTSPCCRVSECDVSQWFAPPNDPFFDDQAEAQLALQGNDISNATYGNLASWTLQQRQQLEYTGILRKALEYKDARDSASTCICVFPNDNPANPVCMGAYNTPTQIAVIQPYGKAYSAPYTLVLQSFGAVTPCNAGQAFAVVTQATFSTSAGTSGRTLCGNYIEFPFGLSETRVTFPRTETMVIVRIHARLQEETTFHFLDDSGRVTCASTKISGVTQINSAWQWITLFCTSVYVPYDFQFNFPTAYIAECTGTASTPAGCSQWEEETCVAVGAVWNPPSSLNNLRGCTAECCVLLEQIALQPTDYTRFQTQTSSKPVQIDQFRVYGFGSATLPVPFRMQQEMQCRAGGGDQAACAANPDIRFWNANFNSGADAQGTKIYAVIGDGLVPLPKCDAAGGSTLSWNTTQTPKSFPNALAVCASAGATLASANDNVESPTEAYNAMASVVTAYANALNTPTPAPTIFPLTLVDARDTNVLLNPVTTDYIAPTCKTYGCRKRVSYGYFQQAYYATVNNDQYATPIAGNQAVWASYLSKFVIGNTFGGYTAVSGTYGYSITLGCAVATFSDNLCSLGGAKWTAATFYTQGGVPTTLKHVGDTNTFPGGANNFKMFGTNCLMFQVIPGIVAPLTFIYSSNVNPGYFGNLASWLDGSFSGGICFTSFGVIGGTLRGHSLVNWNEAYIHTEVSQNGRSGYSPTALFTPIPTPSLVPPPNYDNSYTLGWGNQAYMPMGIRFWYTQRLWAYNSGTQNFMPGWGNSGSCNDLDVSAINYWQTFDNNPPVSGSYVNCGVNRYSFQNFDLQIIATTSGNSPPFATSPIQVVDCFTCETTTVPQYTWDLQMVPPVGFTWPNLVQSGTPVTSALVMYNMGHGGGGDGTGNGPLFNVAGIDGAVYLQDLGADYNNMYWQFYAKQTVMFDVSRLYSTSTSLSGTSTRLNCGAITRGFGSVLVPVPCEWPYNFLCQIDATPYVALPGRRGDVCGTSARPGGLAILGQTCFSQFPAGNATLNPLGAEAYAAYVAGTLNLFLVQLGVNYDALRAVYNEFPGTWWRFPDAYARWLAGFSSEPGATSVGTTADAYDWVNYDLSNAYGICCGHQVDQSTGLVGLYVAGGTEWCDPSVAIPPAELFALEDLPGVLFPIDNTTDARFVPTCGFVVKPSVFYQQTAEAGPTPDFASQFSIIESTPLQLVVSALLPAISIYNTGQTLPSNFLFFNNVSDTVSGFLAIDCFGCLTNPVVSVWIAPINVQLLYPSAKIVLGTQSITPGVGLVSYSFVLGASPLATDPSSGTYYQVVGWDFTGLVAGATITLQNGIITNPAAIQQCSTFRGKLPKHKPLKRVRANVPINECVLSTIDSLYYGTTGLGECHCDPASGGGGASCASPVVDTQYGRLVCGGLGDGGTTAVTPTGTLAPTGTAFPNGEEGVFFYSLLGETKVRAACKPLDVGRVFRTRLIPSSAFAYPTLYLSVNSFDQTHYVNATQNLLTWNAYPVAQAIIAGYAAEIASFITGDELIDYLGFATPAMLPLFLSLSQNSLAADGNTNFIWTDRSFTFFPPVCLAGPSYCTTAIGNCDSRDTCGRPLPSPISGCSNTDPPSSSPTATPTFSPTIWTVSLCAAVNHNNRVYQIMGGTGAQFSDGNFIRIAITGVGYPPGSIRFPNINQQIFIYVWSSGLINLGISDITLNVNCPQVGTRNTIVGLDIFACDSVATTTGIFYNAPTGGETMTEVQAFYALDTTRSAVFPYGE